MKEQMITFGLSYSLKLILSICLVTKTDTRQLVSRLLVLTKITLDARTYANVKFAMLLCVVLFNNAHKFHTTRQIDDFIYIMKL